MKNVCILEKIYYKICKIIINKFHEISWEMTKNNLKKCGRNAKMEYQYTVMGPQYIEVGEKFHCCRGCRIQAWDRYENIEYRPEILIGDNVSINMNVDISAINKIHIGNSVQIASHVLITDHYHGKIDASDLDMIPAKRELCSKGAVVIDDNVWIGFNVSILPDTHIGKNVIIGANSVVKGKIPPNSVIAGIPAKIIKML